MEFLRTPIPDLILVKPRVYEDARGEFFESFNAKAFFEAGLPTLFLQDNQSRSARGVIRGLHFQRPPAAQGKLVRVLHGAALDVAVDIRLQSPTYGKHFSIELNASNKVMLWIPEGFAHGFLSLEDDTLLAYKCTANFDAMSEDSLVWNDPDLGIDWGILDPLLSEKDRKAPYFSALKSPFTYEKVS